MDCDGTKDGFDLEITAAVSNAVSIPVVASGGRWSPRAPGRCRPELDEPTPLWRLAFFTSANTRFEKPSK